MWKFLAKVKEAYGNADLYKFDSKKNKIVLRLETRVTIYIDILSPINFVSMYLIFNLALLMRSFKVFWRNLVNAKHFL